MRRTAGLVCLVALTTGVAAAPAHGAAKPAWEITARVETPALFDDEAGGDADADDPAIWINPADRAGSRVIGTAKNGGLRVYDLTGREVQSILPPAGGRFNNVDLVTGFGRQRADLAVVTDRGLDKLRIYRISSTGRLIDVTAADAPWLFATSEADVETQATGYGVATFGRYAVVSRRHSTRLGIFRLQEQSGGRIGYRATDTLDLPKEFRLPNGATWTPCREPGEDPQVEGMVVDPEAGVLYAAQEDVALWRIKLDGDRFAGVPRVVERVAEFGTPGVYDPVTEECEPGPDAGFGGRIRADVEGATIYRTGTRDGYLIVSGQGDSRFFVYDRRTNRPLRTFTVVDGRRADGVQHSDGAAATSVALPGYPQGLLVLHDGENTPDDGRVSTNFKYVDWRSLGLSPARR